MGVNELMEQDAHWMVIDSVALRHLIGIIANGYVGPRFGQIEDSFLAIQCYPACDSDRIVFNPPPFDSRAFSSPTQWARVLLYASI